MTEEEDDTSSPWELVGCPRDMEEEISEMERELSSKRDSGFERSPEKGFLKFAAISRAIASGPSRLKAMKAERLSRRNLEASVSGNTSTATPSATPHSSLFRKRMICCGQLIVTSALLIANVVLLIFLVTGFTGIAVQLWLDLFEGFKIGSFLVIMYALIRWIAFFWLVLVTILASAIIIPFIWLVVIEVVGFPWLVFDYYFLP